MPRLIRVVKINKLDGCKHEEMHTFNLPTPVEPRFYRSVTSFSAFFHHPVKDRKTGRHTFRSNSRDTLWYSHRPDEWELSLRSEERMRNKFPLKDGYLYDSELPVTEHGTIWDFYKHIGYDYKKRKWLK